MLTPPSSSLEHNLCYFGSFVEMQHKIPICDFNKVTAQRADTDAVWDEISKTHT